jgi:hypothetical protein
LKIAFITDSEQQLYVFPELIEALSSEVKDLEAREFFVPSALDIPAKCLEALDCELIFVQELFEKEDLKLQVLMQKLVDFELEHKVKVVKAIEPSELEDALTEEDFTAVKSEFVEKWSQVILGVLFDQEVFKPSMEVSENAEDESTEGEEQEEGEE